MSAAEEWRSAKDPTSEKTYYFNIKTKETTWTMPLALRPVSEQYEIMLKQRETKQFFSDMEKNIRNKMDPNSKAVEIVDSKEPCSAVSKPILISQDFSSEFDRPRLKVSLPFHASSPVDEDDIPLNGNGIGHSSVDDLQLSSSLTRGGFEHFVSGASRYLTPVNRTPVNSPPVNSYIMMAAGCQEAQKEEGEPRKRRNSTGTIYVQDTMSKQDNSATIQCVCTLIYAHLLESSVNPIENDRKFDMLIDSPVKNESKAVENAMDDNVPSLDAVSDFFDLVYSTSQLESECIIMAMIYIERLLQRTKGTFSLKPNNWRSVLFASLVMASKVWDDLSMWNVDFSNVSTAFDLHRVNELELALLECFEYEVKVSAGEYAKFYFHIRSLIAKLGYHKNSVNDLTPLDMDGAMKLQLATEKFEENHAKGINPRRHASVTFGKGCLLSANLPVLDPVVAGDVAPEKISLSAAAPPVCRRYLSDTPMPHHHHSTSHQIGLEDLMHSEHNDADGLEHVSQRRIAPKKKRSTGPKTPSEADAKAVHEAVCTAVTNFTFDAVSNLIIGGRSHKLN